MLGFKSLLLHTHLSNLAFLSSSVNRSQKQYFHQRMFVRIKCVNTSEVSKLQPGSELSVDRYCLFLSRSFLSTRPRGDLRNYESPQLITSTAFHPVTLCTPDSGMVCTPRHHPGLSMNWSLLTVVLICLSPLLGLTFSEAWEFAAWKYVLGLSRKVLVLPPLLHLHN